MVTTSYFLLYKYEIYCNTFYSSKERTNFINYAAQHGLDVWVDIFDEWGLEVAKKNINNIQCIKIPPTIILDQVLVNKIISSKKIDKYAIDEGVSSPNSINSLNDFQNQIKLKKIINNLKSLIV